MRTRTRTRTENAGSGCVEQHGPCLGHLGPWVQPRCPAGGWPREARTALVYATTMTVVRPRSGNRWRTRTAHGDQGVLNNSLGVLLIVVLLKQQVGVCREEGVGRGTGEAPSL